MGKYEKVWESMKKVWESMRKYESMGKYGK